MKSWQIQGGFGLEHLKLCEREAREPERGEVRLKMRAASLNYRDLMMVQGAYNPRQRLPLVPGSDGVGVVDALGEGVTRWEVGDRLIPCFAPDFLGGAPSRARLKRTLGGPLDGMLTERVIVAEQSAVRAPDHLSDEEAACLPCAALTAWSALATFYSLRPGQVVLTQGTGGVSLFALQLALAHGAEVIVTSSSDEKLERVVEMGATGAINYRADPDWGQAARAMTPERLGVDHVIEVGGANTLAQSLEAVRFGGHISLIGVLSGVVSELNLIPILMQNIRVQGVIVGHRDGFEQMNRALAAHAIRPVISHRFGFDELPEAFDVMRRGDHFGKITLAF